MLSIISQGPLAFYSDGVPEYPYTFSDGSVLTFSVADAQDYVNTQNQLQQLQSTSNQAPSANAPTQINLTTGGGVPGGLDIASSKSPSSQITKLTSTANAITTQAISLISAIASGTSGISLNSLKTLGSMAAANLTKLKVAASIPDFSKIVSVPAPPALPTIPNFSAMGIPTVPTVPTSSMVTTVPYTSPYSGVTYHNLTPSQTSGIVGLEQMAGIPPK